MLTQHQQAAISPFPTHFWVPGWWVRAYEIAVGSSQNSNAIKQSWESGLAPAHDDAELNALAVLLASLQQQLLTHTDTDSDTLVVEPEEHRKHATSKIKNKLFSYERILQGLSGLRLLTPSGEDLTSSPLFIRERWTRDVSGNGYRLELKLSDLGREMLLGYFEPYTDLWRRTTRRQTAAALLGSEAPLGLWRSTWLELQGVEQALLLRLEKAMQWEFRWLQLDGIFGQSMTSLFHDLRVPPIRASAQSTETPTIFQAQQKVLERVGKKLCDHGLLSFRVSDHYLAIAQAEAQDLMIVWQASRDRLATQETADYSVAVQKNLAENVYSKNLDQILAVLCGPGATLSMREQAKDVWHAISNNPNHTNVAWGLKSSSPILAGPLFVEWSIRQSPAHPLPLPESFEGNTLTSTTTWEVSHNPVGERFEKFCALLADNNDLAHGIRTEPILSLACPAAQEAKIVADYISKTGQYLTAPTPSPAIRTPEPKISHVPTYMQNSPPPPPKAVPLNMKRIAAEELQKLRSGDPQGYLQLKKTYIASLDSSRQKLILDVQQRMQPDLFDDHLRHSLVKYMIENPSAWRSTPAKSRLDFA